MGRLLIGSEDDEVGSWYAATIDRYGEYLLEELMLV
jgi:hypothetical protein